jgi:hypothetical protein
MNGTGYLRFRDRLRFRAAFFFGFAFRGFAFRFFTRPRLKQTIRFVPFGQHFLSVSRSVARATGRDGAGRDCVAGVAR